MDRRIFLQHLAGGALLLVGCGKSADPPPVNTPPVITPEEKPKKKRLLVLTQTVEFCHDSIGEAVATIAALGAESEKWEIAQRAETEAEVAAAVTASNLRTVDAVVFANTTGKLTFTEEGRAAFYQWMRDGGAYVGFHSASDTFHNDPDYLELLGGEFLGHGPQVEVDIFVQDAAHPACRDLPSSFRFLDEIYEFKHWSRSNTHVLLSMHQHPQTRNPGDYPISWTKRYGNGRTFYCALGHRHEVYRDPLFRKHLTGGIIWALGLQTGNDTVGNPIV